MSIPLSSLGIAALSATLSGAIALTVSTTISIPSVLAQSVGSHPIPFKTIPEAFDEAITHRSQDAFSTTFTTGRQIDWLFGIAGFPEIEVTRDSQLAHELYVDVWQQQLWSGPIIRTPDMPSPFNSNTLSNPTYLRPSQPVPGSEFGFERFPLR
ncbi:MULTISPECIES: hypothetical protein [Spirulina sp. CCY15215]|uniref:hypothetical protein n=1 Tax=Spirulina sp. CCY15215 TaxID=2767591 RepID=UPI00194FA7FD|nr:hypothetical protein [Spirulina major]